MKEFAATGLIIVYDHELVNLNSRLPFQTALALLLAKKGLPIVGEFDPEPDYKNYIYEKFEDPIENCTLFRWKRKEGIKCNHK
jgi:hypothetical protein